MWAVPAGSSPWKMSLEEGPLISQFESPPCPGAAGQANPMRTGLGLGLISAHR